MPKELKVSPNQRVDLKDFEYGTRTFTVDSLRAHITRLMSGGYRGGFVLEGFRVQVSSTPTDLSVSVTNGIALDRTGKLVTFEEGDLFLNNPLATKSVNLLESAPKNYLMIEYTLADSDSDQRAFWDPTYPVAAVTDSGGDSVPVPKGKEFNLSVATRKAQSWTPIISATGFEDAADPNKLRIPIAIIPVDTTVPSITIAGDLTYTGVPTTPLIEKPLAREKLSPFTTKPIQYIQCADTRIFPPTGYISIQRREIGAGSDLRNFFSGGADTTVIRYIANDRQNNRLYLEENIKVAPGTAPDGFMYGEPEIGDVVVQVTGGGADPLLYVRQGSKYDCRPLFYAVTESDGSREEDPNDWPINANGERQSDSRQYKYWSGISLLSDPQISFLTLKYPETAGYGYQSQILQPPRRTETRIKQNQDFVRVVASIIEEIKYGVATRRQGSWSEDEVGSSILAAFGITSTGGKYLVDSTAISALTSVDGFFNQNYVGATVRILDGPQAGTRLTVSRVYGDSVLEFSTSTGVAFTSGTQYEVEVNFPTLDSKYVDAIKVGSLKEVFNARIDEYSQSYAQDLSGRFTANKSATITVGDGVTTFGDYNGNLGLEAAFNQAYGQKRATTIHVKNGSYLLGDGITPTIIPIGPDTTVVGDGLDSTKIEFNNSSPGAEVYFLLRDYNGKYFTPATSSFAEITVSNVTFKDISIGSENSPVFTNAPLVFETKPNDTAPGAATEGSWRPRWSAGTNTASPVKNLKFIRTRIVGGNKGSWITTGNLETPSYSVYLVADALYNITATYNDGIVFNECEFQNYGGCVVLKDCQNVKVENCDFLSMSGAGIVGLTFCSRTSRYFASKWDFLAPTYGNVIISGCTFSDVVTAGPVSTTYPSSGKRGWINFTPTYGGKNNLITNCLFSGMVPDQNFNSNVYSGYPVVNNFITPVSGTAILKCSPFELHVEGCVFDTYTKGIMHNYGDLFVSDCNFRNVSKSIVADSQIQSEEYNFGLFQGGASLPRQDNFWSFLPSNPPLGAAPGSFSRSNYWGDGEGSFRTFVKGCTFSSPVSSGTVTGIDDTKATISVHPARLIPDLTGQVGEISSSIKSLFTVFSVKNCEFVDVPYAISLDTLKPANSYNYTTNIVPFFDATANPLVGNWDAIQISDCSFEGVKSPVSSSTADWHTTAETLEIYANRSNPIRQFIYSDNKHVYGDFQTASESLLGYLCLTGSHVQISNNKFNEIRSQGETVSVLNPVVHVCSGSYGVEFSGNSFWGCGPAQDNQTLTMLQISMMSSSSAADWDGLVPTDALGTKFNIENNKFSPRLRFNSTAEWLPGRVCNGIYIDTFYKTKITSLDTNPWVQDVANFPGVLFEPSACEAFHPTLSLTNNDLHLMNGNFGLVSIQHYGERQTGADQDFLNGYGNLWGWQSAEVTNNNILLDVIDTSNNSQYGNDIRTKLKNIANIDVGGGAQTFQGTIPYNYLGCSNASVPSYYYACVDLRIMFKCTGSPGGYNPAPPTRVMNNLFQVRTDRAAGVSFDGSQDVVERVGLRISKFPDLLYVKNNTFTEAPLILRWTWNNPYHTTCAIKTPGSGPNALGFSFNISDNSFVGIEDVTTPVPLHVDINPAIGFGSQVGAFATDDITPKTFSKTVFHNNTVTNNNNCVTAGTWPYKGVLRFWFPHLNSWVGPDNAGAATSPAAVDAAFANWLSVSDSAPAPGGFGWGQYYAPALVDILGSNLENSYFIFTDQVNGGGTGQDSSGNELATNRNSNMHHLVNIDKTCLSNWVTSVTGTELTASGTSLLGHFDGGTSGPMYGMVVQKAKDPPGTPNLTNFFVVGTTMCILGRQGNPPIKIVNGYYGQKDAATNDVEILSGGSYIDGEEL